MMVSQNQVELKCMPELYAEKDIQDTIKKFFIISSVLAWGDEVPKDSKTNWLSDSNILVYCKVKRALEEQLPKEEYDSLVDSVLASFPFAKLGFDYTVRVLAGHDGTSALVRVLIESSDGEKTWGTVGVSTNIIEASYQALVDSFEYYLLK
jgi:hypothetical protein